MIVEQKGRQSRMFTKYSVEEKDRINGYLLDDYLCALRIDTDVLKVLCKNRIKKLQRCLKEIENLENENGSKTTDNRNTTM